jgi:hypothetical protein
MNTEFGFRKLAIDSNVISVVRTLPNLSGNAADLRFDNGLIYETNGWVVETQAFALSGKFRLPGFGYGVLPDSANNRAYFLSAADTDSSLKLWAYDLHSFLPVGNVNLPGLSGWPSRPIRCGPNVVALHTSDNQLFLIQLSTIQAINPAPVPTPTIGQDAVIKLPLQTNDLIFDPGTQKIYASLPGNLPGIGNSIAPIDPASGNVSQPVFVGADPTKLALSTDNHYLYVGLDASAVRRFDLQSQSPGLQFLIGFDNSLGPLYVNDMEVQPGNPNVVAIARRNKGFDPSEVDAAIYDNNGVRRPTPRTPAPSVPSSSSESPGVLYASTIFADFEKLSVDASGASVLVRRAG